MEFNLGTIRLALAFVCWVAVFHSDAITAAEPASAAFAKLGEEYAGRVQPILKQFCWGCHATAKPKGELDLERFATLAHVRRDPKVWLKAAEMLDNGEMPPAEAKQPTATQPRSERRRSTGQPVPS
jgi:hypothetical protein